MRRRTAKNASKFAQAESWPSKIGQFTRFRRVSWAFAGVQGVFAQPARCPDPCRSMILNGIYKIKPCSASEKPSGARFRPRNILHWLADSPNAMKAAGHFLPCFQCPAEFWRITAGHCLYAAQIPMLRLISLRIYACVMRTKEVGIWLADCD